MYLLPQIYLSILLVLFNVCSSRYHHRNLFQNEFKAKKGISSFMDIKKWREMIKNDVLDSLSSYPQELKSKLIAQAEVDNKTPWESLQVTKYHEFEKTGNRYNFEMSLIRRRAKIANLVFAELFTMSGNYLDQIANGLWLILEESTWVAPAHMRKTGLPNPNNDIIDLAAAEAGTMVAWIRLLLHEKLSNTINSMYLKRINYEIRKRITLPCLTQHFHWEGHGTAYVNNWNIWINSNIVQIMLLAVDNSTERNNVIVKAVASADNWLNNYQEDGAAEEGPKYWDFSAGRVIELVDLLSSISGGVMSWKSNQLIQRIGEAIYKLHIDGKYFYDYSDSLPIMLMDPFRVFLYGTYFNDTQMSQFGKYLLDNKDKYGDVDLLDPMFGNGYVRNFMYEIRMRKKAANVIPKAPQLAQAWMPDMEVVTLRSQEGSASGVFFGAKGHNNGESHGHNNVGNFIFYLDGKPAIIDVGVAYYSKTSFSSQRYTLWYMQSQWHNLPTINGCDQKNGANYKAKNVKFTPANESQSDTSEFELDIADAYPNKAQHCGVQNWKRHFLFDGKQNSLTLTETYELSLHKSQHPIVLHFMTALNNIDASTKGKLILNNQDENHATTSLSSGNKLSIDYDEDTFHFSSERKSTAQELDLNHVWGDFVTRINFTVKDVANLKGKHQLVFKMIE